MMFQKIEAERSSKDRLADATKVVIAVSVILAVAALVGARALEMFGISLNVFSVAGGFVLAWMGFSMLGSRPHQPTADPDQETQGASLTPLILFAASPGTITGVITLSVVHTQLDLPIPALVAIAVTMAVTWIVMVVVARMGGQQGPNLARDTLSRFMGLIVLAMGVQFMLTGIQTFMKDL